MTDDELKDGNVERVERSQGESELSDGGSDAQFAQGGNPPTAQAKRSIDELDAKCAEYLSGWKRALADYENLQKNMSTAKDDDKRRVRSNLAHELLPVIDNFGHALKFIPDTKDCSDDFKKRFDVWLQGITYIEKQFADALSELGVEPIASVGTMFDPNLHESGGSKSDPSKKEHEVLEELVKGWKIGDVVLRPAQVMVNELSSS